MKLTDFMKSFCDSNEYVKVKANDLREFALMLDIAKTKIEERDKRIDKLIKETRALMTKLENCKKEKEDFRKQLFLTKCHNSKDELREVDLFA